VPQIVDERAIDRLAGHDLLERVRDRLRVREAGMLLLDAILAEIVR
jgi:oxygen-independent coproporphyrinogen-3 oxidase